MSDPLVPNYKKEVGRLAVDRFDFQDHVDGQNFKHNAKQIDLFPTVVIESTTVTNVQDAIAVLAAFTVPPVVADATTAGKGIVQLIGDIGGFATNVVVTGLQGKPVSTLTPNDGDVLTWDSGTSVWEPSPATNAFSAAGDLSGTNVLQRVIALTGTAGNLTAACNSVIFGPSTTPLFTQSSAPVAHGTNFTVTAQSGTATNRNGGDVVLQGGGRGSGGLRGGVQLRLNNGATTMAQATEVAVDRRVLSLVHGSTLSTVDMPADTGDMVIYVRDAVTTPNTGNPTNGTILYSTGGQLWVKQQDGNNFAVGSAPNPDVWGTTGQQQYKNRSYTNSAIGAAATAFTFNLPDNSAVNIAITFVGKGASVADAAHFRFWGGYVRNGGGAPVAVGSQLLETKATAGAGTWTVPSVTTAANTLQVFTGHAPTRIVSWLVVVELSISQG
jgi:hypothetical protein